MISFRRRALVVGGILLATAGLPASTQADGGAGHVISGCGVDGVDAGYPTQAFCIAASDGYRTYAGVAILGGPSAYTVITIDCNWIVSEDTYHVFYAAGYDAGFVRYSLRVTDQALEGVLDSFAWSDTTGDAPCGYDYSSARSGRGAFTITRPPA